MSSTTTSSGAVLAAASTSGLLLGSVTDWKVALCAMLIILALGFVVIFFARKRKKTS